MKDSTVADWTRNGSRTSNIPGFYHDGNNDLQVDLVREEATNFDAQIQFSVIFIAYCTYILLH